MSIPVRVQLDIRRIHKHLAAAGDVADTDELLKWLNDIGFRDEGDGWWTCEEISLRSLDKSEVLRIVR